MLKSNIWKYYAYSFFFMFILMEPIFSVYLQDFLTFSLTQLMILAAIFTFISGILEIPTGVVGDKLGYKKTLFLASFFILIGAIIYIPARTFFHIIIADIFWAIGFAFNSGTSTSFIYDTLKNLKKEKEFKKIIARSSMLAQIVMILLEQMI